MYSKHVGGLGDYLCRVSIAVTARSLVGCSPITKFLDIKRKKATLGDANEQWQWFKYEIRKHTPLKNFLAYYEYINGINLRHY